MTYTGTLRKSSLEGGFYELESTDGVVYTLDTNNMNLTSPLEVDKLSEVTAQEASGFGIHMTGNPTLVVDSLTYL